MTQAHRIVILLSTIQFFPSTSEVLTGIASDHYNYKEVVAFPFTDDTIKAQGRQRTCLSYLDLELSPVPGLSEHRTPEAVGVLVFCCCLDTWAQPVA